MKSWGVRIAIIYGAFVTGIIVMVSMAMKEDIELVSNDYYAKELMFQSQINNTKNGLGAEIVHFVKNSTVTLHFPVEFNNRIISGRILFFKPSDSKKDVVFPIHRDAEGKQVIHSNRLSKGMYKIKIQWESNNKNYYQEKIVVLN